MRNLLVVGLIISLTQSCVFIRIDDSIDLGNKYRFIQDYPQAIIYHKTPKYKGAGINVVPPNVTTYKFDNQFIIAKSKDLEDKQIKYWIVDKKANGELVEPLDSVSFYNELKSLDIELKF